MSDSTLTSLVRTTSLADYYEDLRYKQLLTDSRQLALPQETVFFAIKGERHNGHHYIKNLFQKGVRHFVIDDETTVLSEEQATFYLVKDTISALQDLATHHRKQFKLPVIAITGSNGKTIVKEWLSQLLGDSFMLIKSPKSYNSQIGVPLSVWQLNERHNLAIFEAGISQPDEMAALERVIQPNIGIMTNLGSAHDEYFESRLEKAREKIGLFKDCKFLICRDVYPNVNQAVQELKKEAPQLQFFGWTTSDTSIYPSAVDVRYLDPNVGGVNVGLYNPQNKEKMNLHLPFSNPAYVENCIHCIVTMVLFDYTEEEIQVRINRLKPIEMRLELKQGLFNCTLIDDTYNNDFAGLSVALDFLNQQSNKPRKVAILSDMPEESEPNVYEKIFQICADKGVERVVGIGEEIKRTLLANTETLVDTEFFATTDSFLEALVDGEIKFGNEVILIKGAREFKFEKIVEALELKVHGTKLEINLNALAHNLNFYRSLISPKTRIMAMVKAFAYGSGNNYEIAHLLQYHRVDYLAVAYTDEGVALRREGIQVPIMVMNPSIDSFEKLYQFDLEPEIYSISLLKEYLSYARRKTNEINNEKFGADLTKLFKIHLKLDTGMHRLGFQTSDLPQLLMLLHSLKDAIEVESVFTHLAAADDTKMDDFTNAQLQEFEEWATELERQLGYSFLKHALNSVGIVRFPKKHFDMVRLGVGLYGVDASNRFQGNLLPISTLKATISQIKEISPEETVGYSRNGKVKRESRIATIAIGYADGFDRRFGNGNGKVWVAGEFAPTIGSICMDMSMIDITDIPKAKEGDEVIIFGQKPSVSELAQTIGTIPYEILTNVSERVKRVFYAD